MGKNKNIPPVVAILQYLHIHSPPTPAQLSRIPEQVNTPSKAGKSVGRAASPKKSACQKSLRRAGFPRTEICHISLLPTNLTSKREGTVTTNGSSSVAHTRYLNPSSTVGRLSLAFSIFSTPFPLWSTE